MHQNHAKDNLVCMTQLQYNRFIGYDYIGSDLGAQRKIMDKGFY